MTEPRPQDALVQHYLEASAQDPRRPPDRVREAVRAHAHAVITARTPAAAVSTIANAIDRPAANQSSWQLSLLASVALAGITGLLVLQFERAPPEEREAALGVAAPRRDSDSVSAAPTLPPRAPAVAPTPPSASPKVPAPAQANPVPPAAKPLPARSTGSDQEKPVSEAATQELAMSARPADASVLEHPAPLMRSSRADAAAQAKSSSSPSSAANSPENDNENSTKNSAVSRAMTPAPQTKARDLQGLQQAMLQAARAGNTAQLESLVQQGAALNGVDGTGRTALIWAAINNHTGTAHKLLALGVDKAVKDRDGLSALQHAQRLNLERMAALLAAGP